MAFPLAGQSTSFEDAFKLFSPEIFKKYGLSPEQATESATGFLKSLGEAQAYKYGLQGLRETPDEIRARLEAETEAQRKQLEYAQELGKESVAEAYKYKMLSDIPKTIAQSFQNIANTNLYAGQAISQTAADTLRAYPQINFPSFQYAPQRYFS